ncbi:MAG: aminotransferase class III-fold pyridoxal phosphate-dependent enzyme [Chloroflexota bacterium]
MVKNWTFTDLDARLVRELGGFLPARIFDAHTHVYRVADLNVEGSSLFNQGPPEVGIEVWRAHSARVFGASRLAGGLFLGTPTAGCDRAAVNAYLLAELARDPGSRGAVLVAPGDDPAQIETLIRHPQVAGLKPYHLFSADKPTFQADIPSYLPEWAWELAHTHGLTLTLHMVKSLALADAGNQRHIRELCKKYPNARLILAHAARGFHAPNTARGLHALRGLDNVWFDMAAVCEPEPLTAILRAFGPRRLLWGSDFPVSENRGRAVTVGDGFVWLQSDTVNWEKVSPECQPVLVVLESLRALRQAAADFGLDEADVQDIFCDNAWRLLGLIEVSGTQTQDLYRHAKTRFPGGTQLLSKRPEMMAPEQWPAYFSQAHGCEVWDLDGRRYYDMSMNGIGACLLGYRDPDVTQAVLRRVNLGAMTTLNPPEEVALADLLCQIHPWAEQVRLARSGGEIAAVAVRIARATTDRSVIAVGGYHGWHDWYLAANLGDDDSLRGLLLPGLAPLGVPRELRGTTLAFQYGDREAVQRILNEHGHRLAAVIMEPCRGRDPEPGFLEFVRDGAHRCGALLIFDEISIGWRLHFGGAHLRFGVDPDLAIFAKALGNGHPIAAVIGTRAAMEGAHDSFISSTYWTESVGPAAALAALLKMQRVDAPAVVARVGEKVFALWQRHAAKHGLPVTFSGYPCLAHFQFEHEQANELRTLYTQLMLARGFLAGTSIYATTAHTDEIIALYGEAIDAVFAEIAAALAAGDVPARLKGPAGHVGFRRLIS